MLKIVRNDIAKMKADALVNCASSQPTIGAGFMARGDYQPVFLDQALFAVGCPQLYGMVEGKRAR